MNEDSLIALQAGRAEDALGRLAAFGRLGGPLLIGPRPGEGDVGAIDFTIAVATALHLLRLENPG